MLRKLQGRQEAFAMDKRNLSSYAENAQIAIAIRHSLAKINVQADLVRRGIALSDSFDRAYEIILGEPCSPKSISMRVGKFNLFGCQLVVFALGMCNRTPLNPILYNITH